MNSVNLIGRLTKEPNKSVADNVGTMCNLTISIDDIYSKYERLDFVSVVVYGNQAENCERYLRKGFLVGISGRIHSKSYTDSEGMKRYPVQVIAERIQFLEAPYKTED